MPSSSSPSPSPPSRATLVTGCSSGIGRAIAIRVAQAGWPVYASARDPRDIRDLTEHGCEILALDVTHEASRRTALQRIGAEHGALGALVNNAGYGQQGPFEETPLSEFRRQFETNVFGAIALCQGALPGMRSQGWGRIVNLSSMGGRLAFPGGAAYHGSKYALEAISDVLRFEVAGFGIDVVLIEPGPTRTEFGRASIRSLDALPESGDPAYDALRAGIRNALEATFDATSDVGASTPEEVAEAVWRALSDDVPEARVVVGTAARHFIELKEASTEREWDRILADLYPQPAPTAQSGGRPAASQADSDQTS